MQDIFPTKPQDIVLGVMLSRPADSLFGRRFVTCRDSSMTAWSPSRTRTVPVMLLVMLLMILVFPEAALATISTDASAAGWQGVQGKVHNLFKDGIAPIATYAGIGIGVVTMAATDRPALKAVGGGLAGLGLMVSAGPTIMQTLSGTAIF